MVLALAAVTARGAPLAEWAPLDGLSETMVERMRHLRRSRCLPDAGEVALPVYPGARVIDLDWGRVAPACADRDGWSDLGAVSLITDHDEARVAAWYAERLDGYAQYVDPRGRLFIAAPIGDFLWERDYHKYTNVAVRPAPQPWAAAGYRTMIELNRPAP